jgi:3-isopropylmalate/(R)-2-methylmalate dehydratase small subunit
MAQPYGTFTSAVIPLPAENVDTDQIVPARYLKVTDKAGLRDALFHDWRYDPDGGLREPLFVMDRLAMSERRILLVGDNFGTGSSREHAPWALVAWGIRALISTSFADIFRNNALKNGLLPVAIDAAAHASLLAQLERDPEAQVTVDLARQSLRLPDGTEVMFPIDPFARTCLLEGVDELGYILRFESRIAEHERRQREGA